MIRYVRVCFLSFLNNTFNFNSNFNLNFNFTCGASGSLRHGLHAPDRERCAAGPVPGQAVLRRRRDGQRRRSVSFALPCPALPCHHFPVLDHLVCWVVRVAFAVLPVHGPISLCLCGVFFHNLLCERFFVLFIVGGVVCASVCLALQLPRRALPHAWRLSCLYGRLGAYCCSCVFCCGYSLRRRS